MNKHTPDAVGTALFGTRHAELIAERDHLRAVNADLLAALQMICDAGVPLADPIERAMLDALSKAKE